MWKPILGVAAAGVGGYVIWQVVWTFLLPILGAVLGFLWVALKIGLVALLIYVQVCADGPATIDEELPTSQEDNITQFVRGPSRSNPELNRAG